MTHSPKRIALKTSFGTSLSTMVAGGTNRPAILLLHGFPSSARTFREVIPELARQYYVIAPDLPGFGRSDLLPETTFDSLTKVIAELLDHLAVEERFIYLHDFGAPVGLRLAMNAPEKVLGLIIQNANAHRSGFGPGWKDTLKFWEHPSPQNETAATTHLTLEGTRDQYIAGVPEEVARRISPEVWKEDWRVMSLPGHIEMQRRLVADYASHAAQFEVIADYLQSHQPPAIMLWGRHDSFFDIAEIVSWMKDLPRMEAHIFDAGHFLLETHAAQATLLIREFIESVP